jgi:hypothetical protein
VPRLVPNVEELVLNFPTATTLTLSLKAKYDTYALQRYDIVLYLRNRSERAYSYAWWVVYWDWDKMKHDWGWEVDLKNIHRVICIMVKSNEIFIGIRTRNC